MLSKTYIQGVTFCVFLKLSYDAALYYSLFCLQWGNYVLFATLHFMLMRNSAKCIIISFCMPP